MAPAERASEIPSSPERPPGRRQNETPGLPSDDVADVHLAALAIEHGLILCTHDHGFGRFTALRWSDPLA